MRLLLSRAMTIARREYVTTVRRKAFVVALLLTPTIFLVAGVLSTRMSYEDARARQSQSRIVALVDSSGVFADAPLSYQYLPPVGPVTDPRELGKPAPPRRPVEVLLRRYDDQAVALDSLDQGHVRQVLVVAPDFLASGRLRLYENDTRVFTSSSDQRPLQHWLTRQILSGSADSNHIERTLWLGRGMDYLTKDRNGRWAIKDDAKELAGFLLPFALAFLLAMAIVSGGQYLLQGIAEEKETRILESLMCNVSPEELLLGKLVGLGGAGMTLVGVWVTTGVVASASTLAFMQLELPASLLVLAVGFFLLGYLFYASLMMGIGALAGNVREAAQTSGYLTLLNFIPFWIMAKILNSPNSEIAVGMSFFPPTAATTMIMRLSAASVSGAVIPPWQVAASLGTLALASVLGLLAGAKLFRIGMLLYGKAPNLPEILRILRQK